MPTPAMPLKKSRRRLKNWLIGLGLATTVLIGGAVGHTARVAGNPDDPAIPGTVSSAPPSAAGTGRFTTPSGPVELQMGDPASIGQNGVEAATLIISHAIVSWQPIDQYAECPQNRYFVAVHVEVKAAASLTSGFDVNPLDFYALSGSTHYDEGDGNAYEGPHNAAELNATAFNAGDSGSGWLLFDLPTAHSKIVYTPNLYGRPLADWTF